MKRLLLLFAACVPAFATVAFTAGTACASVALVNDQPCALGSVTAGQLIWVGVSWAAGTCSGTMVVTDGVNTYTAVAASQAGTTSARTTIYYTVATTSASLTVNVHSVGGCFISVMPGIITGQAVTSSFVGETLASNGTSVQSCTIGFTRTGTQLMTTVANDNVASADVGWSTTGSTGTFTLGAKVSNGNVSQPGLSAFQRVTSGTAVNGVSAVTAAAGGMACSGFSINEQGIGPGPQHRVSR